MESYAESVDKNYAFNEYAFVELSLYNIPAYKASFNQINAILTSSNLMDAVTYCFNQCGMNNILISKADNNTSYPEFKILPESGIKNIMRIVYEYNFHKDGTILFFDLTESYLLTNKIGCHAWKNNEYKATYFMSLTENNNTMGRFDGVYINTKEKYNVIVIDKDAYISQDGGTSPIVKDANQFKMFQIKTKQAILSMLTPNKEFVVNIDSPNNKKYNGKYRLRSVALTLTPLGEFFEPEFTITLIQ